MTEYITRLIIAVLSAVIVLSGTTYFLVALKHEIKKQFKQFKRNK